MGFRTGTKYSTGASIRRYLTGDKLSRYLLALPSTNEQHHVIAKVDQLMALCDALKSQTEAFSNKQTALLNVLMAQM
jgi:type I restriction enzyme S subunit